MVILKTIGTFLLKLLKSKWFWFISLGLGIVFFIWSNREKKLEIERLNNNNTTLNQSFKTLQTKNGELYHTVNALTLKRNEFVDANKELAEKLKAMGLKLKNVQSITELQIEYLEKYGKIEGKPILIRDTVYLPSVIDSASIFKNKTLKHFVQEYQFTETKETSTINGKINIPTTFVKEDNIYILNKTINPYVDSIEFKINDTLTVVPNINYKRVWIFFRRPESVTVFIKSENKTFNLEQIKTYQITK